VIPSDTPTVLYCHASILSFWTFFLISFPKSSTVVQLMQESHVVCSCGWLKVDEPMAGFQLPDAVTYNAYCGTVSATTTTTWDTMHLLARVALPPNTCNTHVRLRFHGLFGRHAGCIQHCLGVPVSGSCNSMAGSLVMANLSPREIVACSKGRGVFVQCRLAISHGILCEVRKAEEAWLLWLSLFFKVARIHCG
jgi:hypothetical protein